MIEILNYIPASKGIVIGYVDIRIDKWDLVIRHVAHLEKNGSKWFSLPQYSEQNDDGTKKFIRYIEFGDYETTKRLLNSLSEELKKYLDNKSSQNLQKEMDPYKRQNPIPDFVGDMF